MVRQVLKQMTITKQPAQSHAQYTDHMDSMPLELEYQEQLLAQ